MAKFPANLQTGPAKVKWYSNKTILAMKFYKHYQPLHKKNQRHDEMDQKSNKETQADIPV